jgi:hypothetical protein
MLRLKAQTPTKDKDLSVFAGKVSAKKISRVKLYSRFGCPNFQIASRFGFKKMRSKSQRSVGIA